MDSIPSGQFHYQACTVGEDLRKETIGLQRQQTALQFQQNRIMELLAHNQNRNKLPQPRVPVFGGNPTEYRTFVRDFENLVESRTFIAVLIDSITLSNSPRGTLRNL